jgi:Holliday junction resolvase RusA-like endonuclease
MSFAVFTIPGAPVPKGRPRFGNGHTYTPQKTRDYETLCAYSYHGDKPCEGTLSVRLTFYMPIPQSATLRAQRAMRTGVMRPAKRPDLDNLVKAVLDGLNGVAWYDDKQIVELISAKHYSDEPRTEVEIQEIDDG